MIKTYNFAQALRANLLPSSLVESPEFHTYLEVYIPKAS